MEHKLEPEPVEGQRSGMKRGLYRSESCLRRDDQSSLQQAAGSFDPQGVLVILIAR
jgi:hypothetical protein